MSGGFLSSRRAPLMLAGAVVIFVVIPFLSWYGTWFGRPLTDRQIDSYLQAKKARKVQHALLKVVDRMQRGDSSARRWYPQVRALAQSPVPEIRINAAWAMGQDNKAEEFHQALLPLLEDADPGVRQNAALSLVRFGDARGRPQLLEMLRSCTVRAPRAGTVAFRLKEEEPVGRGALLARIDDGEVRSPLAGHFLARLVKDGARLAAGDPLLTLSPSTEQVWEALRALYLVGTAEDLPDVERYTRGSRDMPPRIQQQAELTARAIRARN